MSHTQNHQMFTIIPNLVAMRGNEEHRRDNLTPLVSLKSLYIKGTDLLSHLTQECSTLTSGMKQCTNMQLFPLFVYFWYIQITPFCWWQRWKNLTEPCTCLSWFHFLITPHSNSKSWKYFIQSSPVCLYTIFDALFWANALYPWKHHSTLILLFGLIFITMLTDFYNTAIAVTLLTS